MKTLEHKDRGCPGFQDEGKTETEKVFPEIPVIRGFALSLLGRFIRICC